MPNLPSVTVPTIFLIIWEIQRESVFGNRLQNLWLILSVWSEMVWTTVRKSLSQHTQNNYIRGSGHRDGERDEGSRDGGMGTNRWINELSGEKGIWAFIVPPCPTPLSPPVGWSSVCCKCSPRFPSASLPLHSSPNRNGSLALNM